MSHQDYDSLTQDLRHVRHLCSYLSTNNKIFLINSKRCRAFDMMDGIKMMKDPATGEDIRMRIGCHSGSVVAGIVGMKMPR